MAIYPMSHLGVIRSPLCSERSNSVLRRENKKLAPFCSYIPLYSPFYSYFEVILGTFSFGKTQICRCLSPQVLPSSSLSFFFALVHGHVSFVHQLIGQINKKPNICLIYLGGLFKSYLSINFDKVLVRAFLNNNLSPVHSPDYYNTLPFSSFLFASSFRL